MVVYLYEVVEDGMIEEQNRERDASFILTRPSFGTSVIFGVIAIAG